MNNDYQLKKKKLNRSPAITASDYADINNLNAISLGLYLFHDPLIKIEFNRGRKDHYKSADIDLWIKNNKDKASKLKIK